MIATRTTRSSCWWSRRARLDLLAASPPSSGAHKNPPPRRCALRVRQREPGGRLKLSVKFYLTAILFVVFDIEAVFIYPWAVQFRALGWVGLVDDVRLPRCRRRRARLRAGRRERSNGRAEARSTLERRRGQRDGFATTRLDALLGWARKYSLFQYPFVTACCGMEFMALTSPRFDIARFGAEAPRFSPRQSRPALGRRHDQPAPGARAQAHLRADDGAEVGARVRHLRVVRRLLRQLHDASPGIDKIIPCDVYVPGCPPRPEAVLDGLMLLQDKIARGDRTPGDRQAARP